MNTPTILIPNMIARRTDHTPCRIVRTSAAGSRRAAHAAALTPGGGVTLYNTAYYIKLTPTGSMPAGPFSASIPNVRTATTFPPASSTITQI